MMWTTWTASGNTWVGAGQEASADPYLVWAELTGMRSLTPRGTAVPERITVLLELKDGVTPAQFAGAFRSDVQVGASYLKAGLRCIVATLSPKATRTLTLPGNAWVKRLELSMPVHAGRPLPRPVAAATAAAGASIPSSAGPTLLGVIDTGCPFANQALLEPISGRPRLLSLWDQDPAPAFGNVDAIGAVTADFGYGRAVDRSGLWALMQRARTSATGPVDEDRCYELAGTTELRRAATHGAHVLGQLAGPMRLGDRIALTPERPASRFKRDMRPSDQADIAFVQLPRATWADPCGLGLGARVLDGLHHILSCSGPQTRQVIVNLSCATYTGPHDGSTILSNALAELTTRATGSPQLTLVVPAGNARQRQWRAQGDVPPGDSAEFTWRVPPGSEAPAFLEAWADAQGEDVSFSVKPPRGLAGGALTAPVNVLVGSGALHAVAIQHTGGVRGGAGQGTLLLMALPPATGPDATGPGGDWVIRVSTPGKAPVHVGVYVARSESEMGAPLRHRSSKLVDSSCDPTRYLREAEVDPDPATARPVIRVLREGTVGAPASGAGVIAAGGLCLRPGPEAAAESGEGLKSSDWSALMDESKATPGIPGMGSRSAGVVRLRGTSFAAPQVARIEADRAWLLPAGAKGEPPEQGPWQGTKGSDPRTGNGVVIPRSA